MITLIAIMAAPFLWIGAGWLGNKARRRIGNMHLPYEERVRILNGSR